MGENRLYGDLAPWFHLLSAPGEYVEEAAIYSRVLEEACESPPRTVLELGSGAGNNASHMKSRFELTLVEPSEGMLILSKGINPECEHVGGDMRSVRLGRAFDAVFVHDAVDYMLTESDLRAAIETVFEHCKSGGVALFAPDHVRENFKPGTEHGGNDAGGRGLRYLEWTSDPDSTGTTYVVDYAYLLRDETGTVSVEHDRHRCGLFARDQWMTWLAEAGFVPRNVPFEHSELEPGSTELFVASKP
ncbi:MAG: class I SAM-dependent methyltransferase [Actinomycetota bacterium]|nr:class I SAM-dependent methyltransferase [Actinomycetota bacterium]